MKKWTKILAVLLAIAVVGSAIGTGVALAANPGTTPGKTPVAPPNPDTYLTKLAARLGVTLDALKAAQTAAEKTTLDQLVSQGRLTAEQRQKILDNSKNRPGFGTPFFPGVKPAAGQTPVPDMYLANLAAALKTTVEKLKTAMDAAQTDVINEMFAQGKITEQQKQQMLDHQKKIGGFPPAPGPGFGGPRPPGRHIAPGLPGDNTFLDRLAAKLGITRQKLDEAIKSVFEELKNQPKTNQPPASNAPKK
jgi:polyhydroxyalkanoate synthesis regulator phasin